MKGSDYFLLLAGVGFVLIAGFVLVKKAAAPTQAPPQAQSTGDQTAEVLGAIGGLATDFGLGS